MSIKEFKELGFTTEEAMKFIKAGITPEEVKAELEVDDKKEKYTDEEIESMTDEELRNAYHRTFGDPVHKKIMRELLDRNITATHNFKCVICGQPADYGLENVNILHKINEDGSLAEIKRWGSDIQHYCQKHAEEENLMG